MCEVGGLLPYMGYAAVKGMVFKQFSLHICTQKFLKDPPPPPPACIPNNSI